MWARAILEKNLTSAELILESPCTRCGFGGHSARAKFAVRACQTDPRFNGATIGGPLQRRARTLLAALLLTRIFVQSSVMLARFDPAFGLDLRVRALLPVPPSISRLA